MRVFCFQFAESDTEDFVEVSVLKKNGDSYFSELQPNWKHELSFVTLDKLALNYFIQEKIIRVTTKISETEYLPKTAIRASHLPPQENRRISFKISLIFRAEVSESPLRISIYAGQ